MCPRIGVCTWSLQPTVPADLVEKTQQTGLACVQLALDPLGSGDWPLDETLDALRGAGIEICSGMMRTRGEDYTTLESIRRTGGVRLDENWSHNLETARRCGKLAREIGIDLVSFHAGFLPPRRDDPMRRVMIDRLGAMVDALGEFGVRSAFETGQETAATLMDCLDELDRACAGVNFDPANMILYDHGDPVESLRMMSPRVMQIHLKDAVRTATPGQWGRETPLGQGQVDWPAFFAAMRTAGVGCDLMLEREAGGRRIDEIRAARQWVERLLAADTTGAGS